MRVKKIFKIRFLKKTIKEYKKSLTVAESKIKKQENDHVSEIEKLKLKHKNELSDQEIKFTGEKKSELAAMEKAHSEELRRIKLDFEHKLLLETNKLDDERRKAERENKKQAELTADMENMREQLLKIFSGARVLKDSIMQTQKQRQMSLQIEGAQYTGIFQDFEILEGVFKNGGKLPPANSSNLQKMMNESWDAGK